jgi:predicted TIM-barrel fold metal-dependent hydrolase
MLLGTQRENSVLDRRDALIGLASGLAVAATGIPARANTVKTPVDFHVPSGSCDCHVHIIGDAAQFPFVRDRVYTPPPATTDMLTELHRALKMDRVVLVQPSFYGTDNACMLDALRRIGSHARGVAVIDKSMAGSALEEMKAAGVRGVRINLETSGQSDVAAAKASVEETAEQVAPLGWHIQFYTRPSVIVALADTLAALPVPVVFDHFAGLKAALGPTQPGYDVVVGLVQSGHAYAKISAAYRLSDKPPDYADIAPIAQALAAANPDRVVWGSDWPHTNPVRRPVAEITPPANVDDGLILDQLLKWVPDTGTRRKILVDNPQRLYGFPAVQPT